MLKICRFIGNDMPEKSTLFPRRFVLVLFIGLLEQIMQFNGIIQSYPDIIMICNNLAIFSVSSQLLAQLLNRIIKNDVKQQRYFESLLMDFYKNAEKVEDYIPILNSTAKLTRTVVEKFLVIFFIIFHIPILTAWITSVITREFVYFAPVYLPLIDYNSLTGYVVNSVFCSLFSTTFGTLIIVNDAGYAFHGIQVIPMVEIICLKLRNLSKELSVFRERKTQKSSVESNFKGLVEIELQLIDVIRCHQRYQHYFHVIHDYSRYHFFVIFCGNSIAIGLCIVVVKYISAAVGIALIAVFCTQVAVPCVIGSIIDYQNTKILDELKSFPWYDLSRKSQKTFLQFIQCCQNSGELKIVIIGSINMELFTQIINAAYSYLMFILSILKD